MEKILIIDDSQLDIIILKDFFEKYYEVIYAKEGETGFQLALSMKPRLILLNIILPGKDGFEILTDLKHTEETKRIPVILLTSLTDLEMEEKGLRLGAVDYIKKPYNPSIVMARVHTHIELSIDREMIENKLFLDTLTGIYNRRYFNSQAKLFWKKALIKQVPFSILIVDIDYFKQVNDTYGHLQGDYILKAIAATLSSLCFGEDMFIARYGGEEFVAVLYNTEQDSALELAEQIRYAVIDLNILNEKSDIADIITVSIGGTTTTPTPFLMLSQFIEEADHALYAAKSNGRNQVIWKSPVIDIPSNLSK